MIYWLLTAAREHGPRVDMTSGTPLAVYVIVVVVLVVVGMLMGREGS